MKAERPRNLFLQDVGGARIGSFGEGREKPGLARRGIGEVPGLVDLALVLDRPRSGGRIRQIHASQRTNGSRSSRAPPIVRALADLLDRRDIDLLQLEGFDRRLELAPALVANTCKSDPPIPPTTAPRPQ